MKNTAARRKGQRKATVYRRFFVSGGKMIFRKEKEHGVLTEEEILDMARDIAENDPAYIIGSMLIKSVCDVIFCERKEWIGIEERSSA